MPRPTLVRLATFVATVVAAWGVLSLGGGSAEPELSVGELAPREYRAQIPGTVTDTVETEALRQEARESVPPIEQINEQIESTVNTNVTDVFDDVQGLVIGDPLEPPAPQATEAPPTTASEATTETTVVAEPALLTGSVFLDVEADGVLDPEAGGARVDTGVERVAVMIQVGR